MKRLLLILSLTLFGLAAGAQRPAATPERTRVLIALDCSESMWGNWQSDAKIKVAQRVLLQLLDSIQGQSDIDMALRLFGHLGKEAGSTRLEVPFETGNLQKLRGKLKALVPGGNCAAAAALESSSGDFPHGSKAHNIILVITDSMDDAICGISQRLQRSGTVAKTFVIALGSSDKLRHGSDCAALFYGLPDEELLGETLREIFCLSGQKAHVTLAVNDNDGNRYETDVPVVFYDHQTHAVRYAAIYHYGTADPVDTLAIDPWTSYDITFFTKPPVQLYGQQFRPGRHSQAAVTAPQGSLCLRFENKRASFEFPAYPVIVRQHGQPATLSSQALGTQASYLEGSYDLEVLSTPAITLPNVAIRNGAATEMVLPIPGQLALNKPQAATAGCIFACRDGALQWVCDLDPGSVSERIVLMPGDYQVLLTPQGSPDYASARTAHFTIQSARQKGVEIK